MTLNVKSSTAVSNVTPSELLVTGGSYTISGPTPTIANVPAGGAGVNFTYTVTPLETGEYYFSASAESLVYSWPSARSSSVLVSNGGPQVVTWNLGSNEPSTEGVEIISGVPHGIYAFRGDDKIDFWRYGILRNTWASMASPSSQFTVKEGGALVYDGGGYVNGYIYAFRGDGTNSFSRYDIDINTWSSMTNAPANVKSGGALTYLDGKVYAFRGDGRTDFWRYDPTGNSWSTMAPAPVSITAGGALTNDGTSIYALAGNTNRFFKYTVTSNTWSELTAAPQTVKWGGALVRLGNYIYATRGDGKKDFWRYDISLNIWEIMAPSLYNIREGGSLTTDGQYIYALIGDGKTTFMRYDPSLNSWSTLQSTLQNVKLGGSLAYVPGTELQYRSSHLEVDSSLIMDGELVEVSMTFLSTSPLSGVTPVTPSISATNGASATLINGPANSPGNISIENDEITFKWIYQINSGSTPGTIRFSGNGTASGNIVFPTSQSNTVIVSPELKYSVYVNEGAVSPIINSALFIDQNYFNGGVLSNEVQTKLGASIGDYVWYDRDRDGIQDVDETGLAGVSVNLFDSNGVLLKTTVTDESGYYYFPGLALGNYEVEVLPPMNMVQTFDPDALIDSKSDVSVTQAQDYFGVDFGYDDSGCIGDYVFADHNGNAIYDSGESGLPEVQVSMFIDNNGNGIVDQDDLLLESVSTDTEGYYCFIGYPEGNYIVIVDEYDLNLPSGYQPTVPTLHPVQLDPGENYELADFGFTLFGQIGDFIWFDSDGDGEQDVNEPGISGVQVILEMPDGTLRYTNTGADGSYYFSGLPSGSYIVKINTATLPSGLLQSYDFDNIKDNLTQITLGVGEINYSADFGYTGNGSIGDTVWLDLDGNGIKTANEEGIPGVVVSLYKDLNNNGLYDAGEPLLKTTATNSSGEYIFDKLVPGNYIIKVNPMDTSIPLGNTNTTPTETSISLIANEIYRDADFGFGPFGVIGDTVYLDNDYNGIFGPGDYGLQGVAVYLKDTQGNIIQTTVTDANGYYYFDTLISGVYKVEVESPPGYISSTPITYDINLQNGDYYLDADFGFYGNSSIGDRVWNDIDGDGIQDVGENGLEGIVVYLYEDENNNGYNDEGERFIGTAVTSIDGFYLFEKLPSSQYLAVIYRFESNIPEGYAASTPYTHVVDLPINTNYWDADFGFTQGFSALGDTVFFDKDGNGIQDTGTTEEYGIAGVEVVVYKNINGTYVEFARETTDVYGHYFIGMLTPGDYMIELNQSTIPDGYSITTPNPLYYTFSEPTYYNRADFGLRGDSLIGDYVWYDENGNGLQDADESGIPNVPVELWQDTNENGVLDIGIGGDVLLTTTLTNESGLYSFNNLSTGTYFIRPDSSELGLAATTAPVLAVTITSPGTSYLAADFGFGDYVTIGDKVWEDVNENGLQDPGEPGLAGIIVILTPPSDIDIGNGPGVSVTTITDNSGNYYFYGIQKNSGLYLVQVDPSSVPQGYNSTVANVPPDDAIDSDSINGAAVGVPVGSTSSSTIFTIDFGYIRSKVDLSVIKSHPSDLTAGVGDNVVFTIIAVNYGETTATGVVLTDILPKGMNFVSIDPLVEVTQTLNADETTTLVWLAPAMLPGGIATYEVTVVIESYEALVLRNTVSIVSVEPDVNMANNTAIDDVMMGEPAFTLIKEVWDGSKWVDAAEPPGPSGIAGEPASFRITVKNTGNIQLNNIVLSDVLTAGEESNSIEIPDIETLAPGESFIYEYEAALLTGQNVNTISAETSYNDQQITVQDVVFITGDPPRPSLDIQKLVSFDGGSSWYDADTAPGPRFNPDEDLDPEFKFIVTNTGNVTISDITVDDNVFGTINSGLELQPNEEWESETITQHYIYDGLTVEGPPDWLFNQNVSVKNQSEDWQFSPFIDSPHNEGTWVTGANYWETGYWYFNGIMMPGESLSLPIDVVLSEELTTNAYQGATFYLQPKFESIQTTHEAVFDSWEMGYVDPAFKWLSVYYSTSTLNWEAQDGGSTFSWSIVDEIWELID